MKVRDVTGDDDWPMLSAAKFGYMFDLAVTGESSPIYERPGRSPEHHRVGPYPSSAQSVALFLMGRHSAGMSERKEFLVTSDERCVS